MKKVIIAFVVLIATVFTSNAQVFVGGGVGLDYRGGKYKSGNTSVDAPSLFSIQFMPKVGFYLTDNFAIGFNAGLLSVTSKDYNWRGDEVKLSIVGWEIGSFARYNAVGVEKLSLLLEGSVGLGGAYAKEKVGPLTTDGDPVLIMGLNVMPVLSYSLTDRLSIEASCDFLRFGYTHAITIRDNSGNSTNSTFGFGVNTSTLNSQGNSTSLWKLGLIFKF